MNVESPIDSVVPTLDGPVLEVLAASSVTLSLTEIHRRSSRGALTGVRLVLQRLTQEGIVDAVPGGYLLNREHVATGAINALVGLRSEFISRLVEQVLSWSYDADLVGLFGSFARRDGDAESDIDILVVGEERLPDGLLDDLASRVLAWTGNHAQIMALTRTDLRRLRSADEPILTEWHRDLEMVLGDVALLGAVVA